MKMLKKYAPWGLCCLLAAALAGSIVLNLKTARADGYVERDYTHYDVSLAETEKDSISFIEGQQLPALSRMSAEDQREYIEPLQVMACVPAAVIGILFDDVFNALFYNPTCVALALIIFGVAFIVIENWNKSRMPKVTALSEITYQTALMIGVFQVIAAVFPGTSRSGATIVGALLIGISRTVAAEYTFFLAIPVMFGASLLKVVKFGFAFTSVELVLLAIGTVVSFVVSLFVLRFLMGYIKKHDFKVFGWYRIVLGAVVLLFFLIR